MKIAGWFLLLLPCALLAQSREDPQLAAKAEALPPFLQWIRMDHDRQESIIERTVPIKEIDGMAGSVAEICASGKALGYRDLRQAPRSRGESHVHDHSRRRFLLHDYYVREVSAAGSRSRH